MAKKFTVLLGAGASMDAGLPDAYQLTRKVYDRLIQAESKDARLFAVVVAKLIARNTKNGHSPFAEINIEEVYDALKRLLNRHSDLLSEFVSGWDPISIVPTHPFDSQAFANDLAQTFELIGRRNLEGRATLRVNQFKLQSLVQELQRALEGDFHQYRGGSLAPFLSTLSDILSVETAETAYVEAFLRAHGNQCECIATLNYDQLVEVSAHKIGMKIDLGLSQWNEKRFVRFHGQGTKLIKLHGSTDWYIRNDDEILVERANQNAILTRALIFGGQSDKLVPYGPFLHLRHQFQQFLQQSSYLLVIGYSFRDLHLNAIIRSWIATRKNGKIIIVAPGKFAGDNNVFRYARAVDDRGKTRGMRVEIKDIPKRFEAALPEIAQELIKEPDLSAA